MKLFYTLVLSLAFIAGKSQSSTVVISQVYGGGGSSTGFYINDYIEVHNISASAVDLTGYSLQYGSSGGAFGASSSQIFSFPDNTMIPAGAYLLIQTGTAGSAGAPFPVMPDFITTGLSMSASSGKVALVNSVTALGCGATGSPCSLPSASIIDLVAYGDANNGEGDASVNGGVALTNQDVSVRKSNGCQDIDNNNSDFDVVAGVAPRNSGSAVNICGPQPPIISASPNITNLITTTGVVSLSQAYTLSASNLADASGDITITPGTGVEVSLDNIIFSSLPLTVPFNNNALSATLVYVRISNTAVEGSFSSNVTNSGGGATFVVINVTGGVVQNFYSKSSGDLNQLATWGSNPDGSGLSPVNFTSDYQYFNIVNQASATVASDWDVSGAGSKVILGNGILATSFVIPSDVTVSATTKVDVLNSASLVIQNNVRPFLNDLATGSTVNFAQAGNTTTDTIKIPSLSFYNLTLTNGLKYFSGGTTTIRGNLTVDGVESINGSLSPFSTINEFENVFFLNNASFEPDATGDAGRITLAMNSPSGNQSIIGNGTEVKLFRLQRDSINTNSTISLGNATALFLGNGSGGGLRLNQGASTTTTLAAGTNTVNLVGAGTVTTTAAGEISAAGTNINILKSAGTQNAGTLRFTDGSSLNQFVVNLGPAVSSDSINVATDVIVTGTLTLTKGKIVMATGNILSLQTAALISGGSAASFVDGKLSKTGSTDFMFHVGKGIKYAPAQFLNLSGANNYTVQYFNSGYGDYTIDPATLATYPGYMVSQHEYWIIDQGIVNIVNETGSADIIFNYTDATSEVLMPSQLRVAHYDGSDWNDLGGTPDPLNNTTSGSVRVNGVNTFSPFTFSALVSGVLPVTLKTFTIHKAGNVVKINWTTEQEINSKYFIVEQSADGRTWNGIITINAAGNSSVKKDYSFIDNHPARGTNYYRLKYVDNDGKFQYSAVRIVSFANDAIVIITPNPANDYISISLVKNNTNPVTIQLCDVNGKLIRQEKTANAQTIINVQQLSRGTYFVKIIDADNITIRKIIIQ